MNKISFYGIMTTFVLSILLFSSCDQDFSEMGSGIVDDNHFAFTPDTTSTVRAYTQATGVLQTNNFNSSTAPINLLGIYNNPVFGKVKANFVTQLTLGSLNPSFPVEKKPVLDSVVLTIPYFSTNITGSDNVVKYRLDSIKGSGPINLKVFESGYILNTLNPSDNFQTQQLYYSDQDAIIDMNKRGTILNNSTDVKENVSFEPNKKEVIK